MTMVTELYRHLSLNDDGDDDRAATIKAAQQAVLYMAATWNNKVD